MIYKINFTAVDLEEIKSMKLNNRRIDFEISISP